MRHVWIRYIHDTSCNVVKMLTLSPYFRTLESPCFWFQKVGSPDVRPNSCVMVFFWNLVIYIQVLRHVN